MTSFIINPGAGPVIGFRLSHKSAQRNVRAFLREMPEGTTASIASGLDDTGRLPVALRCGSKRCDVTVPGCALARLTTNTGLPPRLYVDGNSWLWKYAVEIAREALT